MSEVEVPDACRGGARVTRTRGELCALVSVRTGEDSQHTRGACACRAGLRRRSADHRRWREMRAHRPAQLFGTMQPCPTAALRHLSPTADSWASPAQLVSWGGWRHRHHGGPASVQYAGTFRTTHAGSSSSGSRSGNSTNSRSSSSDSSSKSRSNRDSSSNRVAAASAIALAS